MNDTNATLERFQKAIRAGGIAGFACTGMTLLVVTIALTVTSAGPLQSFADPWNLVDVGLLLGLSIGILRRSRTAAVGMVLYFIFSKIIITLETGQVGSLPVALLFLYFFSRAAWGTFGYHRYHRSKDPDYRPSRRWIWFVLSPVALVVLLLMSLGMLIEAGVMPDSAAVSGEELSGWHRTKLEEAGIVESSEPILYFYSDAFFSVLADGNFFTPDRVVSYWEADEEIYLESAAYHEITSIEASFAESLFENSVIVVTTEKGEDFFLFVSNEDGKDRDFYDRLRQEWRKARPVTGQGPHT